MEEEIKKIIEENPMALATSDQNGNPHVIAVAYVKVKDEKIVITNNCMETTIKNLKKNQNVCLAVWDKKWKGYQIKGKAKYFEEGDWYNFVKSLKENKNEPCKGAIVFEVNEIKKLG